MALPDGVTTCTVTAGVPVTHTGAAVKTFVSIEPSAYLVHAATGTPLVDFLEELSIAEGVAGQFTLPHTDQAGFTDENGNAYTNWYYTARVTYSTPSKAKNKAPKIKVFQLTTGQTEVDLDKLPGGAPALPYSAPTAKVDAFNGRTGTVTLQESDLPERLTDTALSATILTLAPPKEAVRYGDAKAGRYTLSGGTNGTNSALTGVTWRVPNTLPVSTTRWRLKWRNINTKTNTPLTGVTAPTLKGVYVGTETFDVNGDGTGNFTAAPLLTIAETALPADGSIYTSAWITDTAAQFTAGESKLFSIAVTGTGSWGYCRTQQKFVNSAGVVASQTIGAFNGTFPMYGEWWIEYEFAGSEPVGLFVGDSLTDGVAPTTKTPQSRNLVNTWANRERVAAATQAVYGIDASDVAGFGPTAHYWTRYGLGNGWVPDFAVVWLGSNDLNDLRTEAQIKADLGTIYTQLKAFGIKRIFGATITPRGLVAGQETIRTAINTWLMSRPYGLRDVFEFDRAITLSATATTLDDARYADADAVHLLAPGYAKLSRAVPHIE